MNPVPTGSLSSSPVSAKICAGDNITFTATSGFTSYEFFVNSVSQGVQTGTSNNIFSSTTLTNPSVVKVTATNSSGCSADFNAIPVTVNPLPTGSIVTTENSGTANDDLICSGENVTFTATSGFTNYKFYLRGTGAPVYNGSSNVYQSTSLIDGDYVTVVVTNSNSCVSSAPITSATIHVDPSPTGTLSFSPSSTICAMDPVTFTASPSFYSYNFKINGVSKKVGAGNTFAPTAGSLIDGDIVSVDVSNANTCVTTFNTITMKVNALPAGTLAIAETSGTTSNDGKICAGAPVTFTAPTGFTNYTFLLNGSAAPGQNGTNVYTTSALANNDQVTVSLTNASGCSAILNTYTMVVDPLPAISLITGTMNVCVNSTTSLSEATGGGTWSSSDPTIASVDPSSGIVTGVKAGNVTIVYTTKA
ncbi:MAG: Ig domain-containing protein, partial [Nitrososphaerales archaeon]